MNVGTTHQATSNLAALNALNSLTAFNAYAFGSQSGYGSFGAPFSIGAANPGPSLFSYNARGQTQVTGRSLKDQANNLVSIGSATDQHGNSVLTASLNSSKGGVIAFQSAPPSGIALTGTGPFNPAATPTITDSAGKSVPTKVGYDQQGGAVLQIQLTDVNGKATTFYSQVDSLGFPVSGGSRPPASTAFSDLAGATVQVADQIDQHGNRISLATLTNSIGQSVQYETQSPALPSLATTLTTTNPVGPQSPQVGPQDSKANTIQNLTLYTVAGNRVDQITLYDKSGTPTNFFSVKDSAGNPTQAIQLTPSSTNAPFKAFAANTALTASATPQLPATIHPFATTSTTASSSPFGLFGGAGQPNNPYSLLSAFSTRSQSSYSFFV